MTRPPSKRRASAVERSRDLDIRAVGLAEGIADLIDGARRATTQAIDTVMTSAYFEVGRQIVEEEQRGAERAGYGTQLIERLAAALTTRLGRGLGRRNLAQMRAFFLAYRGATAPWLPIWQTVSAKSPRPASSEILQTASAKSSSTDAPRRFPLPWSHYVELLRLEPEPRAFYETECLRGGWTNRQLRRQIDAQVYERALRSKNKAAALAKPTPPDDGDADARHTLDQA